MSACGRCVKGWGWKSLRPFVTTASMSCGGWQRGQTLKFDLLILNSEVISSRLSDPERENTLASWGRKIKAPWTVQTVDVEPQAVADFEVMVSKDVTVPASELSGALIDAEAKAAADEIEKAKIVLEAADYTVEKTVAVVEK